MNIKAVVTTTRSVIITQQRENDSEIYYPFLQYCRKVFGVNHGVTVLTHVANAKEIILEVSFRGPNIQDCIDDLMKAIKEDKLPVIDLDENPDKKELKNDDSGPEFPSPPLRPLDNQNVDLNPDANNPEVSHE